MWGALSDERTGLSFARVIVSSNKSVVSMYNSLLAASGLALYSRGTDNAENTVLLLRGADHTENTCHVIATQRAHWRADCCLATRYNIRPLRHSFHCCALERVYEMLPGNALMKSITILLYFQFNE
jgi:hypothetical protein